MEGRNALLTAEEVDALLGGHPRTVGEALEMALAEARRDGGRPGSSVQSGTRPFDEGLAGPTGTIRRLIAGALHGAAEAIYPSGDR